jgi:hypothetical protein
MRRVLILALFAAAGWYGWKHYSQLHQVPGDEAVIENESGKELDRFRLIAGDQTVVREVIPSGSTVTLPFRVTRDGSITLKWQYERTDWDQSWTGGSVAAGPLRTRHHLTIEPDGGVIWVPERLLTPSP